MLIKSALFLLPRKEVHAIAKVLYIQNYPANIPLPSAKGVRVKNSTNGEYYLSFTYPLLSADLDGGRFDMLVDDVDLQLPDLGVEYASRQIFRIISAKEGRSGKKTIKTVEACHIGLTLGRYFFEDYIDFAAAQSLEDMLALLSVDTPFTFVVEGTFDLKDIFEFGEKSKLALLHELRELYEAELAFDNYTITVTKRAGDNYGAELRYRRNLKHIQRTVHNTERVTRLFGYGKNGLTIEGYGGHTVKYIDSHYYNPDRPFEASVTFAEIESQSKLLAEMQKYLAKYELPSVSYDVTYVPRYDGIRGVGDTVLVVDRNLGYKFDARIMQFEYNPLDEVKDPRIVLANFREMTEADYIFKATVGSQRAIKYTSKNAVLKGIKYDDSITLVDGMGMAVSDDLDRIRVRLGQVAPGEYGMTLYNKAGTPTLWLDADTGDAQFSGDIIASNIYGSNIRTNAGGYPYVELSSDNNVFRAAKSESSYIEIEANPASYASPIIKHISGGTTHFSGIQAGSYFSLVAGGSYDIGAQDGAVRISGGSVIINGNPITIASNMQISSLYNLYLNGTSNVFFGSMSLSSILAGIYSRLSELENP